MKHPRPEDIRKVADRLESVAGTACLDMAASFVKKSPYHCKTVACHGGFYALACSVEMKDGKVDPHDGSTNYKVGANQMALDLGFSSMSSIKDWAGENPDLWGNRFGLSMFGAPQAFGFDHEDNRIRLENIIKWWRDVADRIEAYNNQ